MKKDNFYDEEKNLNESFWRQETINGDWIKHYETQTKYNGITEKKFNLTKLLNNDNLKMGTMIITKSGFFKLLDLDNGFATILDTKNNKKETVQVSEISTTLNVFLCILNSDRNWFKLTLNANGNMEQLREKITSLKIIDENLSDFVFVANGAILREECYYDQLNFRQNMKIIITTTQKKAEVIKRFSNVKKLGWYNKDHLMMQTNKKMKLSGVGIFGLCQGNAVQGKISVIEGTPLSINKVLVTEEVTIDLKTDIKDAVSNYYFKTPVPINPFLNYSIVYESLLAAYFYFGSDGKNKMECDKGLVISLNKESPNGTLNNISQISRGIISEIHYII